MHQDHLDHQVTTKARQDRRNTHRSLYLRRLVVVVVVVVVIIKDRDREEDNIMCHNRGEGGLVSLLSYFISSCFIFGCQFQFHRVERRGR